MAYGRRNRKTTPPRLRLRKPRPYIEPGPRSEPLAGRARVFWYSLYAVLIVGGIVLILLARH
jgi:hypothetical protein